MTKMKEKPSVNNIFFVRVPVFMPKYWMLKGHYDERLVNPFKALIDTQDQQKK